MSNDLSSDIESLRDWPSWTEKYSGIWART